MMLDERLRLPGAGAKDERESKFLRLGQLQDALLRNRAVYCRHRNAYRKDELR